MKKFKELSDDISNLKDITIDSIQNGEYIIDEVIDVFLEDDFDKFNKYNESNIISMNTQIDGELKRGDKIYVVCLLKKKGTTTFSSPSIQSVICCRIVDIYNGLSYLNRIRK